MAETATGGRARLGRRLGPLLLALTGIGVAAALADLTGSVDGLLARMPLRCPLRTLTDLRCPTCGLGHALLHTATGNVATAWDHHPLGPLLLAAGLLAAVAHACAPTATAAALRRAAGFPRRHPAPAWAGVAGYVAWGLLRG